MKQKAKAVRRWDCIIVLGVLALSCTSILHADAQYEIDVTNSIITDAFTGLTWVRDPNLVPELVGQKTWIESNKACKELVYAGIGPDAWRLPNISDLGGLVDPRFRNPAINTNFFVSEGGVFWSATPYARGPRAWTINFKNGALGSYDKDNPDKPARHYTRCVARV